jgi:hypothetical protein
MHTKVYTYLFYQLIKRVKVCELTKFHTILLVLKLVKSYLTYNEYKI